MTVLHRLVYHSHNRLPGGPDEVAAAIRGILRASQANNRRVGVTGALMFSEGSFGQVLEGPREAVEATFERIQMDERHGTVTLLAFDPVAGRGFPNWSMAYVGAGERGGRYAGLAAESGWDPSRMSGDELFAALGQLVREDAAPAA
jgi:hypothetical protein